jgi:hypothetical protein
MSSVACYFDHIAGIARLLSPDSDTKWLPGNELSDDDAFGPRNRLAEAADWLTDAVGPKKRIDLVCVGVSDSVCRWLSAPSAEPNVVAAAARGKGEEWGAGAMLGTIEPLTSPYQKSKQSGKPAIGRRSESHFPILAIHDAPARVLLDNLDANGVRVGSVVTLWHAMCRAWDDSLPTERVREELGRGSDNGNTEAAAASPITAIIATTGDHSVVWAWSRGRQLITGGRAAIGRASPSSLSDPAEPGAEAPGYEAAFGRIALDWLTWAAQLGQTPNNIIIISPDANEIARQCDRIWPTAPRRLVPEIDPVAATLNRLLGADPIRPESDARTCVATLTNRPGRAHRRLNQWVGVILLAVAVTVIGFGWKLHAQANGYAGLERAAKAQIATKLASIDERLARDPRPLRAIDIKINELTSGNEGFTEPALPLPILNELLRVAAALEGVEGVKVERIEITESRSTLRLLIPDTATGERVIESLHAPGGKIRWIEAAGPLTGRLVFNGAWSLEDQRL